MDSDPRTGQTGQGRDGGRQWDLWIRDPSPHRIQDFSGKQLSAPLHTAACLPPLPAFLPLPCACLPHILPALRAPATACTPCCLCLCTFCLPFLPHYFLPFHCTACTLPFFLPLLHCHALYMPACLHCTLCCFLPAPALHFLCHFAPLLPAPHTHAYHFLHTTYHTLHATPLSSPAFACAPWLAVRQQTIPFIGHKTFWVSPRVARGIHLFLWF